MDNRKLHLHFVNAAIALDSNKFSDRIIVASTGVRQLPFLVEGKTYVVLEQNTTTLSTAAKSARDGHKVFQIRDVDAAFLIGSVDLTARSYTPYAVPVKPVEIEQIEKVLRKSPANERVMQDFLKKVS